MNKSKRTSLDLMNNIYTLAYWMTGSETESNELVNKTYSRIDQDMTDKEIFRTFRSCYFTSIEPEGQLAADVSTLIGVSSEESLRQRFADIKLSVLLSEIPGIRHRDISKIIGKPLLTVRWWLSLGRKSLVNTQRLIPPIEMCLPIAGALQ
ncbi:RNA polymerase subunit sigma-24 [Chlorobium sp. BLA1]|uniref:RNA polymerase subunit sigma-24 n=1 Tax=Candidatus Chlorobium masyuteum TaxID=2716876 RepID=UPI00141FD13A|nr:RNA polymerase subunit sigma-24 [Candidatus Chlorobium masyuteum]NHQ60365.1 RNA polymerase subunit sigma-24 [Candidatus Chlorobium masyuteum]NTU44063.1 RNA polymerase subunit sigma-24 [Chlorobiaceae bacterium]